MRALRIRKVRFISFVSVSVHLRMISASPTGGDDDEVG